MSPAKLEVRDLRVSFAGHSVASVPELNVDGGEIVGLAGESGSGKSMTILAVLGLDVRQGDQVIIAADGAGADSTLDELEALLSADLEG